MSPSARMIKFVDDTVAIQGVDKFENSQFGKMILSGLKIKKFDYKRDKDGKIKYKISPLTGKPILKNGKKQPEIDYKRFKNAKWIQKTEYTQLRQEIGIRGGLVSLKDLDIPPVMRGLFFAKGSMEQVLKKGGEGITKSFPEGDIFKLGMRDYIPRVQEGALVQDMNNI